MKRRYTIYGLFLITVLSFISCDNQQSLQRYYIDSKENDSYISLDIPSSILQLKEGDTTEEIKDILKTIRKINFLGFQLTEETKAEFLTEKAKVKGILKQTSYQELMRLNSGSAELMVKFLGAEDAIDEVVVYGSDKEKGFIVMRILGDEMNPAQIFKMLQNINIDENNAGLEQLKGILSAVY
ncbi:MAG: hypothetical protein COB60_11215 [Flavobacteriaceae bacterium]|nr:MAG: hypothetical protein COB60_11215 [Flavobacteriaceae bacterium]